MSNLIDYVNEAAIYRTVFAGEVEQSRPTCLVTREIHYQAAIDWFLTTFSKKPDFCTFIPPNEIAIKLMALKALRAHPEMQIFLHGPSSRADSIKLSVAGVKTFQFAVDPK